METILQDNFMDDLIDFFYDCAMAGYSKEETLGFMILFITKYQEIGFYRAEKEKNS